ncbi:MAG: hypothetical protein QE570_00305 [Verrucomicrobiota bacterium]|nr:hypothetical protein [Verrucomicrobiota bacterium]
MPHSRLRLQPPHDHLAKGANVGKLVAAFGVEEGDLVVAEEAGHIAVDEAGLYIGGHGQRLGRGA